MIQITCTNCRKQLAIDDAFAGGVCRCQECGTIQTVPARLKQGASELRLGQGAASTSRTLYKQRIPTGDAGASGSGTGLDELAEIVASSGSGFGSSGLGNTPPRVNRPATLGPVPAAVDQKRVVRLVAGVGGVIVVLLLIILAVIFQRLPSRSAGAGAGDANKGATAKSSAPRVQASFCGVPLDAATSVVYVLDRGSSTASSFGNLRDAALRSVGTLGPERKFQLVFWDNGTDNGAYPALLSYANKDNVAAIQRSTADLFAHGQSDARPALERALEQKPSVIVLATGKAWDLDDAFVAMVKELREKHDAAGVRIHTFAIGTAGASTALKTIADETGGKYREIPEAELRAFAR